MRASEPVVPWADIVNMRNRLIHAYFDVEPEIVWETVRLDLPELVQQITRIPSDRSEDK